MNCNCLQNIIQSDKNNHTRELIVVMPGTIIPSHQKNIQKAVGGGILFQGYTNYRSTIINLEKNHTIIDRQEEYSTTLPFFHCPICGTKTKNNVTEGEFYHKIQNEK